MSVGTSFQDNAISLVFNQANGDHLQLYISPDDFQLKKAISGADQLLWSKNAELQNTIRVANYSSNNCCIGFTSNPNDKCLLEFIGSNNGEYLYMAIAVAFNSGAVSILEVLKKEAETYVTAVIENGYIKISGLAAYGVYEARAPKGFNLRLL